MAQVRFVTWLKKLATHFPVCILHHSSCRGTLLHYSHNIEKRYLNIATSVSDTTHFQVQTTGILEIEMDYTWSYIHHASHRISIYLFADSSSNAPV